jgi:hypothetical protein
MSKKEDAQEALLRQQKQVEIERKVAELAVAIAASPVQYARRMLAAEVALKGVEDMAVRAIQAHGITQKPPATWLTYGQIVLDLMAPIRDLARQGLKT